MDQKKFELYALSNTLYARLPFWKRWRANKYYASNNWDVTGAWEQCVRQARRMLEEREHLIKDL